MNDPGQKRLQVLKTLKRRTLLLVIVCFALQLMLGVVASLTLDFTLEQKIGHAMTAKQLTSTIRTNILNIRSQSLAASQDLLSRVLLPDTTDTLIDKLGNHHPRIAEQTREATQASNNAELRQLLRKLVDQYQLQLQPLERRIIGMATMDKEAAQREYLTTYVPLQQQTMELIDQAMELSNQEVAALDADFSRQLGNAQQLALLIIVLLFAAGTICALLLARHIKKLVQFTNEASLENRELLENLLDIVCTVDADGVITRVNGACKAILGYQPEELAGRHYKDFLHEEDREKSELAWRALKSNRALNNFRNRFIRKDGSIASLMWTANWSAASKHAFYVGRDATEAVAAEQALHASQERTRQVVETAHDAFIGMDAEGNVTDWNQQAEATFGWSAHETIGKPLDEFIIPPHLREMHRLGLKRFLETGAGPMINRRIEMTALHRQGHMLTVEITISPIRIYGSYVFSAFLRDITQRKQTERELLQAKENAERATQVKSGFLANMSHEIRTPMNGVISLTKLLLATQLSKQQREYLEMVETSAASLMRLLDDILDFSKLEADKVKLESVGFNLRETVGDSLKMFSSAASYKNLELACRIAPDVPEIVVGDPGRLCQIISNLVGNALKFTSEGQVLLSVDLVSRNKSHTMLHFAVQDTGIGIAEEQQAHIFNAFEQADSSTTRHYGGTGLGLAIVASLVQKMEGRIWVESALEKGAIFHFNIRLSAPLNLPSPANPFIDKLRGRTALLIDDRSLTRGILAETLAGWGMNVLQAGSGRDANMQAKQNVGVDCVLIDPGKGGDEGFSLVESLRSHQGLEQVPIILLSSHYRTDDPGRYHALGINRILQKPVKPSELLEALTAQFDQTTPSSEQAPASGLIGTEARHKLNVLIAEDHAINQLLMQEVLESRGHSYSIASNGIEVLQLMEEQEFDLILMDGQMPEMDGYQATAEIRRRESEHGGHIHIIAVTANAMRQDREICLAAGMDDYMAKPIDPHQLLLRIEAYSHLKYGVPLEATQAAPAAYIALTRRIADMLLQDLPQALEQIDQAYSDNDPMQLARLAHKMAGSTAILDAETLAEAVTALEHTAKDGDLELLEERIEQVKVAVSVYMEELRRYTGAQQDE